MKSGVERKVQGDGGDGAVIKAVEEGREVVMKNIKGERLT